MHLLDGNEKLLKSNQTEMRMKQLSTCTIINFRQDMCYITWSIRQVDNSQCNHGWFKTIVNRFNITKSGIVDSISDIKYNKSFVSGHSITMEYCLKRKTFMVKYKK